MSDLNLSFDTGLKNVAMGGNTNDIGSVRVTTSSAPDTAPEIQHQAPSLSVSDPIGIEFLTKGGQSQEVHSSENTPKSAKSEEFNFFKPTGPENEPKVSSSDADEMISNPNHSDIPSEFKPIHRLSPQDIKNEKIDILYKFKKLEDQGIRTTMNYNMNSHLEDMRNEYIKLKKQREVDNSVKFQRKMLMACVTGVEFLNGRFDPFQVKLDGWGESVNENLNDYDEIFEELNEKYGGSGDMAPELRLMFTLAGSAFMFHLSNTMFKSSIPGMDDVLQQNPELMKQFAEAAVGSMNRANGGPGPRQGQGPGQGQPPNPLSAMMGMAGSGGGAPPGANPLQGLMGGLMGGIMGGDRPQQRPSGQQRRQSHSPARSDMSAPDGIDELINKMNLQPDNVQDLDAISLMSGGSDRKSSDRGITLNL